MFQRQPWMQRAGEFPGGDVEYHELLVRAVFSGGLGPRVVEARWAGIKEAFAEFDPAAVAGMGADDVGRLLSDPGVIRNRRKIEAVIENAGRFLDITAEHGAFHAFLSKEGDSASLDDVAARVAQSFRHLGPASAALFLFSAGWRQGPGAEDTADAAGETPAAAADAASKAEKGARAPARRAGAPGAKVERASREEDTADAAAA